MVKNGLLADFPKLSADLLDEEIVIIGSGISGALMAHQLCTAGFKCTIIDKRMLSSGSTWASTAHVNYELDMPFYDLAKKYSEQFAADCYQAGFDGVNSLRQVLKDTGVDADVQDKSSMYLASNRRGAKEIEREYTLRTKHGFNVVVLDNATLKTDYGINRINALYHADAMQIDPYKAAAGLINYHIAHNGLTVYTRTAIKTVQADENGVTLYTADGYRINARKVICAAGYEAGDFLPKQVMDLNSTYALVTAPLPPDVLWKKQCLIWETARPYFYLRTTSDNRIIIGGQDVKFKNAALRDSLMDKKTRKLLEQFAELFPYIPAEPEFTWCGTFSETKDSLPYIGLYPGIKNVYYALGYGGNGTTYSQIAAEVIRNMLKGVEDPRVKLFGFER